MDSFGKIMKEGWHPAVKDGDSSRIRRMTNWSGKGSNTRHTSENHQSTPLTSLKDPSSFGPPPKHTINSSPESAHVLAKERKSLAPPVSKSSAQDVGEVEQQAQYMSLENPHRTDKTRLYTSHLPLPPKRSTVPTSSAINETPIRAPTRKPNLPPRLPPRQIYEQPTQEPLSLSSPKDSSPVSPTQNRQPGQNMNNSHENHSTVPTEATTPLASLCYPLQMTSKDSIKEPKSRFIRRSFVFDNGDKIVGNAAMIDPPSPSGVQVTLRRRDDSRASEIIANNNQSTLSTFAGNQLQNATAVAQEGSYGQGDRISTLLNSKLDGRGSVPSRSTSVPRLPPKKENIRGNPLKPPIPTESKPRLFDEF